MKTLRAKTFSQKTVKIYHRHLQDKKKMEYQYEVNKEMKNQTKYPNRTRYECTC